MVKFIAALLLLVAAPAFADEVAQAAKTDPAKVAEILAPNEQDVGIGNPEAPLTIIEYSSLSCSHCATFHNHILPMVKKEFIQTEKVYFINRDFPLNAPALKGAILVQCAPAADRAKFQKVLFKLQDKWAFTPDYMAALKKIAGVGGVDEEHFEACMNDEALEKQVLEVRKVAGENLDIQGTPSFFANGEPFPATLNETAFKKALNAKLAAIQPNNTGTTEE